MKTERINGYRMNWVFCSFDLPTTSKEERKKAQDFRKYLLKNGFSMFQYSVYARPCPSVEHAESVMNTIYNSLPHKGNVILFRVTDKQFGRMLMIFSNRKDPSKQNWQAVSLF
jgi:CRISPR-associated protein Cas2